MGDTGVCRNDRKVWHGGLAPEIDASRLGKSEVFKKMAKGLVVDFRRVR
jgi:hypothetical protein